MNQTKYTTNPSPQRKQGYHQFLGQQIRYYMHKQKLDYMAAHLKARLDWQNRKGKQTIITTTNKPLTKIFPEFTSIEKELQPLLEIIYKHCINNKGQITYKECAYTLNLQTRGQWLDFVRESIPNFQKIADYFNKPNKFYTEQGTIKYA